MSLKQIARVLDCNNLFQCFFGLNAEDVKVYEAVLMGFERVEDISKFLSKNSNSVYKSLQKLLISGLVYREKKVIERGGYYFVYKVTPREVVASEVENVLREFCEKVRNLLSDFFDRSSKL